MQSCSLKKFNSDILIIFVLPWLLLIVHRDWPLPGLNFDSLFSWGLYQTYDRLISLTTLDSSHYYTRLGAILPGYAVFHVLPTLWATYTLNFSYWYVAVFSMYFTVKITIDKKAALLTGILMGSYPLLLTSFSAGFNDGPAVSYLSLTLLFFTLAAERDTWWKWLIAAGMSFAGAAHCNLFALNFLPFYLAYYYVVNREASRNALLPSFLFICLGFFILTAILGLINLYFGGRFLFFLPSIKAIINFSKRPPSQNPMYQPLAYITIFSNRHLILPFFVFVAGLMTLTVNLSKRDTKAGRLASWFQLFFIFTMSIFLYWEWKGNVSPLSFNEYVSFSFPLMFLALGAQFGFITSLRDNLVRYLAGGMIIFFLVFRVVIYKCTPFISFYKMNLPAVTSHSFINLIIPSYIISLAIIILLFRIRSTFPMLAAGYLFIVLGILYGFMPDSLGQRLSRDQFLAMDKGRTVIANTPDFINQHRQRFWLDVSSEQLPVYKVIAGIRGGYYDFFKWQEPGFEAMSDTFKLQSIDVGGGRPMSGEVLLLLTDSTEDVISRAQTALSRIGLTAQLIKTEEIEQRKIRYYMTFIKVEEQKNVNVDTSTFIKKSKCPDKLKKA